MEIGEAPPIENRKEGPKQKAVINLPQEGLKARLGREVIDWFYEEVLNQMPDGELKDAFDLAAKERTARLEDPDVEMHYGPALIPGANKYAYRAFTRRSDGAPLPYHLESTYEKAGENILLHGIENPNSPDMILPNLISDDHWLPDFNLGDDISSILVYKNEPFVMPTKSGEQTTRLINLETGEVKSISLSDARERGYPTLRDNVVGQIEIHWIKKPEPNSFMARLRRKA